MRDMKEMQRGKYSMASITTNANEALAFIKEHFNSAAGDPIGKIKVTPYGVDANYVIVLNKQKGRTLVQLPFKFNKVRGFGTKHGSNSLATLDGFPNTVLSNFAINDCANLTSLVGGPTTVGGEYSYTNCSIESLDSIVKSCRRIGIDLSPIPMLRILGIKYNDRPSYNSGYVYFNQDPTLGWKFDRYIKQIKEGEALKRAIWDCQKEMIDTGHERIAKW
jgi:hypothetical protein